MKLFQFASVLLVLLILSIVTAPSRAQFFTKTSKSIPRMGRRADPLLSEEEQLENASKEVDADRQANDNSLSTFMSNLVGIPKFIHNRVISYQRKLWKRSK